MKKRIPVLIDTDIGDDIDDAFALCLAMQSPEIEVLGVTTVHRSALARARMAKALLLSGGHPEIPVHAGISRPLRIQTIYGRPIDFDEKPHSYLQEFDAVQPDGEDAVSFLIETLERSEEKVTVITLGALTNIATLLSVRPDLAGKIEKLTAMGGAYNVNLGEYNFSCDPDAACQVMEANLPMQCVGIDITFRCKLAGEALERIRTGRHPCLKLLNSMNKKWGGDVFLHDPLALMSAFDDTFVTFERRKCKVERGVDYANGYIVNLSDFNWKQNADDSNLLVGVDVDAEAFVKEYVRRVLKFEEISCCDDCRVDSGNGDALGVRSGRQAL